MPLLSSDTATLLLIDFQAKLMPAIDNGTAVVANARRLLGVARMLDVPVLFTEQNVGGLGATVPDLAAGTNGPVVAKMTFDASATPAFHQALGARRDLIITGCEAHICVLQTVLGLLARHGEGGDGRRLYVVRDAIGSRRAESLETAVRRMERHGAEIVTTEMVVFEWLKTAEHPQFRDAARMIR